jgi:hypothetical protein
MHLVVRFRVKPVLHLVLAAVGLVVVVAAVVPRWSELGDVLTGRDKDDAGWVRVAEAGAVFFLVNGAVLGWAACKSQRARSRRASAMRQDWLVARAQARLNVKAAAAHAAAANWTPAPAPVQTTRHASVEMVGQQPPHL